MRVQTCLCSTDWADLCARLPFLQTIEREILLVDVDGGNSVVELHVELHETGEDSWVGASDGSASPERGDWIERVIGGFYNGA